MSHPYEFRENRGYFGIGIYGSKFESNVGVLWRSATNLGADYIFTVGARYKRQRTDTIKAYKHIPLFEHEFMDQLVIPKNANLVCAEIHSDAQSLIDFNHPERAVYLLGAEDSGLPQGILNQSDAIVQIPSKYCMNVSMVGTMIMYDRLAKGQK